MPSKFRSSEEELPYGPEGRSYFQTAHKSSSRFRNTPAFPPKPKETESPEESSEEENTDSKKKINKDFTYDEAQVFKVKVPEVAKEVVKKPKKKKVVDSGLDDVEAKVVKYYHDLTKAKKAEEESSEEEYGEAPLPQSDIHSPLYPKEEEYQYQDQSYTNTESESGYPYYMNMVKHWFGIGSAESDKTHAHDDGSVEAEGPLKFKVGIVDSEDTIRFDFSPILG